MKKILSTIILIMALLLSCHTRLSAQSEITLARNDSLIIELGGYEGGDIFWEVSPDVNAEKWTNISSAKNKATLRHKLITPYYFRSKVVDGTCDPYFSNAIKVNIGENFWVKAGHGYVEPYDLNESGLSMAEKGRLSNWNNLDKKAVWFFYQKAGKYNVKFHMMSTEKKDFQFEMNTTPCYDGLNYTPETFNFTCSARGGGKKDTIQVFSIEIPKTGYYRYELAAKSNASGLFLEEIGFSGLKEPGSTGSLDTHATTYLSSPSVHLGFHTTANTSGEYDWIYQEILVPEGEDPLYTYWMSLGFFQGYMGIQTNSHTERRVLFSAWDATDKDKYPDAPKELLVSLVDKASYTQANSFGNEGTGGQSYVGLNDPNTWKTGTPVKFLMNSRRDGSITFNGEEIRHSIVSAWYDAGEGWRYVASWRVPLLPKKMDMFDGFYSFLENYGWRNGQIRRKGYYYNAFGRQTGKTSWTHFNRVTFGNTDGDMGQRIDYEQGVAPEDPTKFYMVSAGYGETKKTGQTVPLITNFSYLEELDMTPFIERVDKALENEDLVNNLEFIDKTGWEVIDFSSEETSGEPKNNGRAALILDDDIETYWHSAWQSGKSNFPHWFVIDMKEEQTIKGFKFQGSGGSSRLMKNIKIEVSNSSDSGWEEVFSGISPLGANVLILDEAATGYRYFKLTIIDGYNNEVHTRLNEIYVF